MFNGREKDKTGKTCRVQRRPVVHRDHKPRIRALGLGVCAPIGLLDDLVPLMFDDLAMVPLPSKQPPPPGTKATTFAEVDAVRMTFLLKQVRGFS